MRDLGNFEIKEPEKRQSHQASTPLVIPGLLLLLVVAGLTIYFLKSKTKTAHPRADAKTESKIPSPPTRAPQSEPSPEATPKSESFTLPTLNESDSVIRELAKRLSAAPELTVWLTGKEFIRTFVVSVDNIATGTNPAVHLKSLRPSKRLLTNSNQGQLTLDQKSYSRYDSLADTISSLDAQGCVKIYNRLMSLITEAYRELGYPNADFNNTLEDAIRTLLETPIVEGQIDLVQRGIYKEFVDENLQSLLAVQKQLLAMGPYNVRSIQKKILELANALGIPSSELPTPKVYQANDDLKPYDYQ
jgi:hypothetical protein